MALHAEGYRTSHGRPFRGKNVWSLRQLWGLPGEQAREITAEGRRWADGSYTVRGVGQALGVPKSTVHRWLKQGRIEGTPLGLGRRWRLQLTDEQIHALRGQGRRATPTPFIRRRNDNGSQSC